MFQKSMKKVKKQKKIVGKRIRKSNCVSNTLFMQLKKSNHRGKEKKIGKKL